MKLQTEEQEKRYKENEERVARGEKPCKSFPSIGFCIVAECGSSSDAGWEPMLILLNKTFADIFLDFSEGWDRNQN